MTNARTAADQLRAARLGRTPRTPFTDGDPTLGEEWGYRVQDLDRADRLAIGEVLVGAKLGLTSRAKQRTMGVHQPVIGFLTDVMLIGAGTDPLGGTAQPRIEPEIAFRLAHDLDGPDTIEGAVDAVAVAAEIIDSRFAGFDYRLADVLADNTSAAGFALGPWVSPAAAGDLATAACAFWADDRLIHTATGAAILGHPLRALIQLAEHLAERSERLAAGSVVLAGALTDAIPLHTGMTYRVEFDGLGALELTP